MAKSISRYLADISSTSGVLDGTLSTAAQTNITSLGTLSSLTVSGSAAMTLTTAAQPNITSVGTLSTLAMGGSITRTGDLTLDVSGIINLDAGTQVILKDDGTNYGTFYQTSSDFYIQSLVQDKDIVFYGNDGGSGITALRLDMSDAGAATFNNTVTIPKLLTLNNPDSIQAKFSPNNNSFAAVAEFYNGTSTSTPFIVGQGYATGTDNISYVWNRANAALLLGTNNTEKMRITSGGKVGIGTTFTGGNANAIMTAPLNIKLTSGSSAAVATFNLEHSNSSANIEQRLQFNIGDDGTADSYANAGYVAFGKENVYVTDDTRDSYLSFATSTNAVQAEKMRITSAGRVLIGKTSGAYGLDIDAADFSGDAFRMTRGTSSLYMVQANDSYVVIGMHSNHDLQLRTNATTKVTISAVGTTTFTGASSVARIASHSYGTSFETTTSDGSDNMSVSLDAGSGAGSNGRGAFWGCYGNEASGNGGNIVGQTGALGDYKLYGGGSAEELVRIDGTGMGIGQGKSTMRVIVGGTNDTSAQYGMTSGNGNIGIYGKQAYSNCDAHMEIATSSDIGWAPLYINKFNWASGEDGRWIQFLMNSSGDSGTISYDGTNFAVANGSDYRLKENIVDYSGGLAKLEELKVRTYNKKEGESKHITQQGFIAHEAATANIPGFIMGEKDAMKTNEAGETVPDYQTINKEALIPYLVSAIQELSAKVKELESK